MMETLVFLVVCSVMFSQCVQGFTTTTPPVEGSCRNQCGLWVGNCSCSSSCRSYGNCCYDYYYECQSNTTSPPPAQLSCRYNCGRHLGNCSCSPSCQYYGNCCYDYYSQCPSSAVPTTAQPSCRYNCGRHLGSCSCSSSCRSYGNCCYDYYSQCPSSAVPTTAQPSCRYNCGRHLGSCSCSSSCRYYGNCCYDYYSQCPSSAVPTTAQPSCRYNCGRHLGSCSCSSSCRSYGNCCYDYYSQCPSSAVPTTAQPSCRYNCGRHLGSCSCSSSCRYYGNCCYDYYSQCPSSAVPTTAQPSCRYNCGQHLGSCSCSSSCRSYGNCCYDYYYECQSNTTSPPPAQLSCRYNCGRHLGNCSCSSSCQYYGNCCYDYYSQCSSSTELPPVFPTSAHSCGGTLSTSGSFSSPGYPGFYHDNSYCVWQLRASYNHRIYLSFTDLQLENCCNCDYVTVYDGPSVHSPPLGKLCNNTLNVFQSSSTYITVLFRTDHSIVGRGFNAEFTSSLTSGSGHVTCSGDNMNIVIEKSYLSSLGYVGENLYLNDQHCRPQISTYQVIFSFPINTCGTVREFKDGRILYTNALRAYKSNHSLITRQSTLKLNVDCRMEPDTTVQLLYVAIAPGNATITGTGRFNGSMAFYTSSNFYDKVTQVPYEVTLNSNVYVQVKLRRDDNGLVLFLDTCVASPSPHFNSATYDLVRNGCPADNTYYAYSSGTRHYARFTFRAFQFLRTHEMVYLQCKVVVCPASETNSRCTRGCSRRKARALRASEDSHTLVLGPVTLKDLESLDKGSVMRNEEVAPRKSMDV